MESRERIINYLQDAEAAERHFEDALASFSKAGDQAKVREMLSRMSSIARTQHERLRARLEALGSGPSTAKSFLAHILGFPPALAQLGHTDAEKNTQHLMITVAAAAAETGMYEALAAAASAANDQPTAQLALQLKEEELQDYRNAASVLRQSAVDALQAVRAEKPDNPVEPIRRYLEDAIAAEKLFETQLRGFAKEGDNSLVQSLFSDHAEETRRQHEMLTDRLQQLGGSTSAAKTFLAHFFGMMPMTAQLGHDDAERTTQNLIIAFAVENSELAMYESLIAVAEALGDQYTVDLARRIQGQEQLTAEKVWAQIAPCARAAVGRMGRAHAAD